MKKILILLSLGLLSCTTQNNTKVASILYDATGNNAVPIQSDRLLQNLEVSKDNWDEKIVRFQKITGSDYNTIDHYFLPSEHQLLGNKTKRKKKVLAFTDKVKELESITSQELNKSSIFLPLVREISYLNENFKEADVVCILISDLYENSDWINLYRHPKKNSKQVFNSFMEHLPKIKTNGNIRIKIIYQPSANENKGFRERVSLYQDLFKQLNIHVTVGASL